MSNEQIAEFLSRVAADASLQERAAAIAQGDEDPAAAAASLGASLGFDFSAEEFAGVLRQGAGEELKDADLDSVAGGVLTYNKAVPGGFDLNQTFGLFFGGTYNKA